MLTTQPFETKTRGPTAKKESLAHTMCKAQSELNDDAVIAENFEKAAPHLFLPVLAPDRASTQRGAKKPVPQTTTAAPSA